MKKSDFVIFTGKNSAPLKENFVIDSARLEVTTNVRERQPSSPAIWAQVWVGSLAYK